MEEAYAQARFAELVRRMQGLLLHDTDEIRGTIAKTLDSDSLLLFLVWIGWRPDENKPDHLLPLNTNTEKLFEAGLAREARFRPGAESLREYAHQRIFGQPLSH